MFLRPYFGQMPKIKGGPQKHLLRRNAVKDVQKLLSDHQVKP